MLQKPWTLQARTGGGNSFFSRATKKTLGDFVVMNFSEGMSRRTIQKVLEAATGLPAPRLDFYARALVAAGLITPASQGGSPPPPTVQDAARLLLAVMSSDRPSAAPSEARKAGRLARSRDSKAGPTAPLFLRTLALAPDLETALCILIDAAVDLESFGDDLLALSRNHPGTVDPFVALETRVVVRRGANATILVVLIQASEKITVLCDADFEPPGAIERRDFGVEVAIGLATLVALRRAIADAPARRPEGGITYQQLPPATAVAPEAALPSFLSRKHH